MAGKAKRKVHEAAIVADGSRNPALIERYERDRDLGLQFPEWGTGLQKPWEEVPDPHRHFTRKIRVKGEDLMEERIVRFPSAPIYGTNRKREYNIEFPERPNLHTFRVLKRPGSKPVDRLFILQNGLNETGNLRFYYLLANWILSEDQADDRDHRSACLIVPFPGHLMHAPFPGPFSQTPLSRYLSDSGELFRQFLRYMVEMRWLLSAVSDRRPSDWMVGMPLTRRSELPRTVMREWSDLRQASGERLGSQDPETGKPLPLDKASELRLLGMELDKGDVESMFEVLWAALGWDPSASGRRVPVHVVGYSLGGFVAQSVFFAWPNVISSCATICSGGAIRALSPTAFADPEEWQAVLHTLRPELEESMLRGRIRREGDRIAGLADAQFCYYQRIFDQVFLQEDSGSYKARVSEYGTRMLFISGGDDPIVTTKDVLDASPEEGITMLSVAGLTHFLGEDARTEREIEQREFWLPEAGGLIGRAATRAEDLHADEQREAHGEYLAARNGKDAAAGDSHSKAPQGRDLASPDFEDALDWVIDGVTGRDPHGDSSGEHAKSGEGWLFVCRNGLPAAFLGADMHRAWGTGLHHHDVSIQRYAAGLARRAGKLERKEAQGRITLILPPGLEKTFVKSNAELVDPHSDAPGTLTTEGQRQDAWDQFMDDWGERVRWLGAGPVGRFPNGQDGLRERRQFAKEVARWQRIPSTYLTVSHLPDVWISVDNLTPTPDPRDPEKAITTFIDWVGRILSEQKPLPKRPGQKKKPSEWNEKAFEKDLQSGRVRIVRVSGAELNPRYRGQIERSFTPALLLLAHCAAALVKSSKELPGLELPPN